VSEIKDLQLALGLPFRSGTGEPGVAPQFESRAACPTPWSSASAPGQSTALLLVVPYASRVAARATSEGSARA
jgi:hypothetical protein